MSRKRWSVALVVGILTTLLTAPAHADDTISADEAELILVNRYAPVMMLQA